MFRRAATTAVVLLLTTSPLHAQTTTFKVGAEPANVYKSATTASPVIGKAPRGAVLEVTRELGSWVRVAWPSAENGAAFVHVSSGSIAHASPASDQRAEANAAPRPAAAAAPLSPSAPPPPPMRASSARARRVEEAAPPPAPGYVRAPSHMFGVGGVLAGGQAFEAGIAARVWSQNRVGLQVQLTHASRGELSARFSSVEFAPSLIYGFRDHVSDYWWLRPYVGGGPTLARHSLDVVPPGDPFSETRVGFEGFGGGEMTFASMPQLAVSADVGYRWWNTTTTAVDDSGIRVAVSAHWYLK
jgi:hypothetical protein